MSESGSIQNLYPNRIALSRREAAFALGVSISTLERWARTHMGPVISRHGGSVRYLITDLAEWAENQREAS